MLVRLKHTMGCIFLTAVYILTKMFYAKLETKFNPHVTHSLFRVTSEQLLAQRADWVVLVPMALPPETFKSSLTLSIEKSRRLRIAGSRDVSLVTWLSVNAGSVAKKISINHTLTNNCWRIFQNCRVLQCWVLYNQTHLFLLSWGQTSGPKKFSTCSPSEAEQPNFCARE